MRPIMSYLKYEKNMEGFKQINNERAKVAHKLY